MRNTHHKRLGSSLWVSPPLFDCIAVESHQEPSGKNGLLGTLKDKTQVLEPEWWKPMSDDEVDTFVEGRD